MNLSILIINWRSKELLRACLKSVAGACSGLDPQVVVVDGGSFDGCGEMLAAEFPQVEFVQSQENLGFGRSNNLGFARCTGELLLLLNPDTELRPAAIPILIEQLASLPGAGLVAPQLLNTDGTPQESCVQAFPTPLNQALDSDLLRRWFPHARIWGTSALYRNVPTGIEAASGACMLMRSELFDELGGFSPQYFMYGEDMDLCRRIRQTGRVIYHVPAAAVVHHGGGSSHGGFSRVAAVWMRESTYRFIRTHQGAIAALSYRGLMAGVSVLRLLLLLPACLLARASRRSQRQGSLQKWSAVLRWCAGFEA